jgi:hypothetical protein
LSIVPLKVDDDIIQRLAEVALLDRYGADDRALDARTRMFAK